MIRLEEIKKEYAIELGFKSWGDMLEYYLIGDVNGIKQAYDNIINLYTTESIKASLIRASENATIKSLEMFGGNFLGSPKVVDEESITEESNIVLL